ncbi:MAG TPA: FliH/SctL family protein [Pseudobdellovibrionaceae bacterium]|nr:FliH/SctL family protein [Pseudobdellovibrionaceae bacterium]
MKSNKRLDKETASRQILEYHPLRIDLKTSQQAFDYLSSKAQGSDFVMGAPLKVQTGIQHIEEKKIEDLADEKMLEKLKEIEESAYSEGKSIGLEEGKKEAFAHYSKEIEEGLTQIEAILNNFTQLKSELLSFNESFMLKLVYGMAKQVVHREVEQQNEVILEVLKQAVSLSQGDENISVTVNDKQFEYVEKLKQQTGREFDFTKNIKFVGSDDVTLGGCIVETNFGVIDSRIDQRLEQLYKNLVETLPKSKNLIAV